MSLFFIILFIILAVVAIFIFALLYRLKGSSDTASAGKSGDRPFLVDFTKGYVGSFLGTEKSNLNPDCVNILFAPLGWSGATKTLKIRNIPKAEDGGYALIENPGEGEDAFCFVLEDNDGNAPIAEQLDIIDTELSEKLRNIRKKREINKAASRELGKLESGSIADQLREAKKIGESLTESSDSNKTRKKRRSSLMSTRREEK